MPSPSDNQPTASQAHVLVADDDAPTRCFLGDAFSRFGARVALASNGSEALEQARAEAFDLLVLDCRMPDAGAMDILTSLRNDPAARSRYRPVVASSAELNADEQQALLSAGFHAVLLKPCMLKDLKDVLALATADRSTLPLLDDNLALHTSGAAAVVQALRLLLKQELVNLCRDWEALSIDTAALEARLHKLRSSCGFCGAASLSEHIASLQRHLKLAHCGVMLPLAEFRRSVMQTIEALDVS